MKYFILVEQRFSTTEINRLLSAIEQIKTRLNLIERLNVSYIYERLQQMQSDLHQVRKRPSVDEVRFVFLRFFIKFIGKFFSDIDDI